MFLLLTDTNDNFEQMHSVIFYLSNCAISEMACVKTFSKYKNPFNTLSLHSLLFPQLFFSVDNYLRHVRESLDYLHKEVRTRARPHLISNCVSVFKD